MLYMLIGHIRRGFGRRGSSTPESLPWREATGLTYLGSWVETTLGRSFHVVECDEPAALQRLAARWRHRVHFEVVPIVAARDAVKALEPLLEN